MPNPSSRGPWETAASSAAAEVQPDPTHPMLLRAFIHPPHAEGRWLGMILILVAIISGGLSLPFLLRGEPMVAIVFMIELTALALAARACRRWAHDRSEELILFADRLEVTTRIGGRITVDRLPTAWMTIEPVRVDRGAAPGFVVYAAQRRLRIGGWLGSAQSQDLRRTLEAALVLARRGGLAASTAPARLWSSRNALAAPVDPALWAGGHGQS